MLATIRDDTWNVLNIQHIFPNSKRWDCSDIPGHMAEGAHNLRKDLNPHPQLVGRRLHTNLQIEPVIIDDY